MSMFWAIVIKLQTISKLNRLLDLAIMYYIYFRFHLFQNLSSVDIYIFSYFAYYLSMEFSWDLWSIGFNLAVIVMLRSSLLVSRKENIYFATIFSSYLYQQKEETIGRTGYCITIFSRNNQSYIIDLITIFNKTVAPMFATISIFL